MKLSKKLTKMINKVEFKITYEDDNRINFERWSKAGQDFNFSIDTENNLDSFRDNILSYYNDFDVSYEAYLWLDNTGHGKNGAPHDMKAVYEDMEECEGFIYELYQIVDKYIDSIRK